MSRSLRHFVVLDFEATCDGPTPPSPQEIIEFPSVLLDAASMEVVDEFEAFVRPTHHPQLSQFCTELTSITQAEVDAAAPFSEVFEAHRAWLGGHGLEDGAFALVTCGDWDLKSMLPAQLAASDPPFDFMPRAYRRWINIKTPFSQWRDGRSGSMVNMLSELELELEGRHHRGIDDCRNIARIARALCARGQALEFTSELPASRYPTLELTLIRGARERPATLPKRALASLLGVASGVFRKQAKRVFTDEGEPLRSDEDLRELRTGARLRIE